MPQPTPPPASDPLTDQARAGLAQIPWRSIAVGGLGASAIGLLGAAGLAPLLAAVGVGALSQSEVVKWLTGLGGNVIAGWVGDLALWAAGKPLASDDPAEARAAQGELEAKLDALLTADARAATELAQLLQRIDAVPLSLAAIAEEIGGQSEVILAQYDLLKQLRADLERLQISDAALGRAMVAEADRVIAAISARADRSDARLEQALQELRTLRATLISFGSAQIAGDVTIGDLVGGDQIKIIINQINRSTPPAYRATVERMAEDYGAVFGGRDVEIARLDDWLARDQRPCAFLHTPTGRGKTALLLHWAAHVQRTGGWHVVIVPISLRYQTHTAASALGALATALAAFHDDLAQLNTTNTSPDQLRPIVADYLRRTPKGDRRLLVLLDGLDEATGWEVGRDLFPRTPGPHLRLIASARERAHVSRNDWLDQLGWEPALTCDLGLEGLSKAAVSDVLRRMGNPLDTLATDVDLLSEIARISQGDPLTIRFLVEALKDGSLKPGRLEALTPGLESFVRSWLEELEHHSSSTDAVYALLRLCAVALGPLTSADIQRLEPECFKRRAALSQAAKQVGRFVIGDGSEARGYVFNHPRLRELYLEAILSPQECVEAREQFVDDGRRWHAEHASAIPTYIRQFWITHLAQAGVWDVAAKVVTGVEQTAQGYHQRWATLRYAAEGTYSGYLSDLDRIWQHADAVGDVALGIRCALIAATIRSLSGNIWPTLLYQLVTVGTPEGKWSIAAALEVVRHQPTRSASSYALELLTPIIPDHILSVAIEIADSLIEPRERARSLGSLAKRLDTNERQWVLQRALKAARSVSYLPDRCISLGFLTLGMDSSEREEIFNEILEIIPSIEGESSYTSTLYFLVLNLPKDLIERLFDSSFFINQYKSINLNEVIPLLPSKMHIDIFKSIERLPEDEYVYFLRHLAPYLPRDLLSKSLESAHLLLGGKYKLHVMSILASQINPGLLQVVLEEAYAIPEESERVEVLSLILPSLESVTRQSVAHEIFNALNTARYHNKWIFIAIFPYLSLSSDSLSEFLNRFSSIPPKNEEDIFSLLNSISPFLKGVEEVDAVIKLAFAINELNYRNRILIKITPKTAPHQIATILKNASIISDSSERLKFLIDLSPMDISFCLSIINEIIRETASLYPFIGLLKIALEKFSSILDEFSFNSILNTILEMDEKNFQAFYIIALHLSPSLLVKTINFSRRIASEYKRYLIIHSIVPRILIIDRGVVFNDIAHLIKSMPSIHIRIEMIIILINQSTSRQEIDELIIMFYEDICNFIALEVAINETSPETRLEFDIKDMIYLRIDPSNNVNEMIITRDFDSFSKIQFEKQINPRVFAVLASYLVPYLDALMSIQLLRKALVSIFDTIYVQGGLKILAKLSQYLTPALLKTALEATYIIADENLRIQCLLILAPCVSVIERTDIVQYILMINKRLPYLSHKIENLEAVTPYIPQYNRIETIKTELLIYFRDTHRYFRLIDNKSLRKITHLIAYDDYPDSACDLFDLIQSIDRGYSRAKALQGIIPYLPPALMSKALAVTCALDTAERVETLQVLMPYLPPALMSKALAVTCALDTTERAKALQGIIPYLPPALMSEALAVICALNTIERAKSLQGIIPYLPPALLGEALAAARAITDERTRAETLQALSPHLLPALLGEALSAAQAITYEQWRAETLLAIIPHLPPTEQPDVLREALAAARAIPDERWRADTLQSLSPHLPPALLGEVLAAARAITDESRRAGTLQAILSHLPPAEQPGVLGEVLAAARAITDESRRADTLQALAPHLAAHRLPLAAWHATLRALAHNGRPALLGDLAALMPWLVTLTTPEQRGEIAQAVVDVCRAWP